jgi:hypothetical protein
MGCPHRCSSLAPQDLVKELLLCRQVTHALHFDIDMLVPAFGHKHIPLALVQDYIPPFPLAPSSSSHELITVYPFCSAPVLPKTSFAM